MIVSLVLCTTPQRCVLPVYFPADLLLHIANPPERKLAKRTSVHSTAATACFYSVDDGKSKL